MSRCIQHYGVQKRVLAHCHRWLRHAHGAAPSGKKRSCLRLPFFVTLFQSWAEEREMFKVILRFSTLFQPSFFLRLKTENKCFLSSLDFTDKNNLWWKSFHFMENFEKRKSQVIFKAFWNVSLIFFGVKVLRVNILFCKFPKVLHHLIAM